MVKAATLLEILIGRIRSTRNLSRAVTLIYIVCECGNLKFRHEFTFAAPCRPASSGKYDFVPHAPQVGDPRSIVTYRIFQTGPAYVHTVPVAECSLALETNTRFSLLLPFLSKLTQ